MIYTFKTPMGQLDAGAVGQELERIRTEHSGQLKTHDVVAEAKDASSPLHEAFTWDDAKAANQHRLWEARFLIRNVLVAAPAFDEPHPAYYNVRIKAAEAEGEQYYQSAAVIMTSPDEFAAALRLMQTKLSGAEGGLKQLLALAPKRDKPVVKKAADHVAAASRLLQQSPG